MTDDVRRPGGGAPGYPNPQHPQPHAQPQQPYAQPQQPHLHQPYPQQPYPQQPQPYPQHPQPYPHAQHPQPYPHAQHPQPYPHAPQPQTYPQQPAWQPHVPPPPVQQPPHAQPWQQPAQQPSYPAPRKTHLVAVVTPPKGHGFFAMAMLSLRRANILLLTLIASDALIMGLDRARGVTAEERALAEETQGQIAAFTAAAPEAPGQS